MYYLCKLSFLFILIFLASKCLSQQYELGISGDYSIAEVGEREPKRMAGAAFFFDLNVVNTDSGNVDISLRPSFGFGITYLMPDIVFKAMCGKVLYILAGSRYITLLQSWSIFNPNTFRYTARDEWLSNIFFVYGGGVESADFFMEFQLTNNSPHSILHGMFIFRFGIKL